MKEEEKNEETKQVMRNKKTTGVPCLQPRSLKRGNLVLPYQEHVLLVLPLKWILSMGWSSPSQLWVKKWREIAGFAILHWTRPAKNLVSLLSWVVLARRIWLLLINTVLKLGSRSKETELVRFADQLQRMLLLLQSIPTPLSSGMQRKEQQQRLLLPFKRRKPETSGKLIGF